MERGQVRQDSQAGWNLDGVHAAARDDWTDLLKTCAQRTEEMRAEHRGRAGLDETEEIVFALARAVSSATRIQAGTASVSRLPASLSASLWGWIE